MRAIVCRELSGVGGLELAEIPPPEPGPGEVRLRVRACGLNFADTLMIKGQYQDKPALPFVPGMEVAGHIDACGPDVAGFVPGERVMAALGHGGFAEMALCPAEAIVRLPESIDDITAAGFAVAYGTAYGALCWAGRLQAARRSWCTGRRRRRPGHGRVRPHARRPRDRHGARRRSPGGGERAWR